METFWKIEMYMMSDVLIQLEFYRPTRNNEGAYSCRCEGNEEG